MRGSGLMKLLGLAFLADGVNGFSAICRINISPPRRGSHIPISSFTKKSNRNFASLKNVQSLLNIGLADEYATKKGHINMKQSQTMKSAAFFAPVVSSVLGLGKKYAFVLEKSPIITKSVTAGLIFGLSDYVAQDLEHGGNNKKNWTRIVSALLVGLVYFGPAAHAWYEMIFRLLPGTSLISTLRKAALGQALFSPSFTCIFFASSLIQSGSFTLSTWVNKIKTDLPSAWRAGMGFWPLVDLVSYSLVPPQWIPLFVNFCSFLWTIYLSIVANKKSEPKT